MTDPPVRAVSREMEAVESHPWDDPNVVIVEVNGKRITRGDFYHRILAKFGARILLNGVIKEELFRQEAERLGIQVPEDFVHQEVERRLQLEANEAGGMDELGKIYSDEGLSLDDVRKDYAEKIRDEALILEVVKSRRRIDDAALRKYYQETYAKTRYRLSQIAYRYRIEGLPDEAVARKKQEALEKAMQAVQSARSGKDFAAIARAESEDSLTRDQGGDMGMYITVEDEMDPAIREAIFKLKEGEVSDPVDYDALGSIHVFKMTQILPHRSFDDCREDMRREMENRLPPLEEIESVLRELRNRATIHIFGLPAGGSVGSS